jgi:hypothetical protein
MPWDPFAVLWVPHEPALSGWRLLRAYVRHATISMGVFVGCRRWSRISGLGRIEAPRPRPGFRRNLLRKCRQAEM